MRVLLIDDDISLCEMLSDYLRAEGFDVGIVHDGRKGIVAATGSEFDVAVLDIMMPQINGIDVLRSIRRESDIPIIMLTGRGDRMDRVIGLEMGADDYVSKPYDPRELLARIRAVLRRRPELSARHRSAVLSRGQLDLDAATRQLRWQGVPIELTASEFNVMEALLRAGGAVKSKDELSREALGRRREAYDRSLDVHVSNIRQKLANHGVAPVFIETVRGVGYRVSDEP
ncbi:response regulator transcription factor [Luteibacter sp. CQ10]|uniref:response regulator transcription factor n=1 Tax=Luteibacter sp. CQ10 TaxID=2805821 RepID=UPI0034A38ED6